MAAVILEPETNTQEGEVLHNTNTVICPGLHFISFHTFIQVLYNFKDTLLEYFHFLPL